MKDCKLHLQVCRESWGTSRVVKRSKMDKDNEKMMTCFGKLELCFCLLGIARQVAIAGSKQSTLGQIISKIDEQA